MNPNLQPLTPKMRLHPILILLSLCAYTTTAYAGSDKGYVVLLHGIARTADSMGEIQEVLDEQGYETINIDYPSRKHRIEILVRDYIKPEIDKHYVDQTRPIHFVTYSLGGVVLRYYLQLDRPKMLGRVVMLAPPNQGSEVADLLKDNLLYQSIYGPAGQQLGVKDSHVYPALDADIEFGVIAGDSTINPLTSPFVIDGEDDGTVSVHSTKLQGMKDHIVVSATHTFILTNPEAMEQVVFFLEDGVFRRVVLE